MDISSIGSLATEMVSAGNAKTADVAMLKKALEIQEQSAMQLVQAIPQPNPAANLPNIGQNLDVYT